MGFYPVEGVQRSLVVQRHDEMAEGGVRVFFIEEWWKNPYRSVKGGFGGGGSTHGRGGGG